MRIYNQIVFYIFTMILLICIPSIKVYGKDLDYIIKYDDVVLEKSISNDYILILPNSPNKDVNYSIYYKKDLTDDNWNFLKSDGILCNSMKGTKMGPKTMLFINKTSFNIEDYNIMISCDKVKSPTDNNINDYKKSFFYSPQLEFTIINTDATIFNYKRIFDSSYKWNITLDDSIKDIEDVKVSFRDSQKSYTLDYGIDKDNNNMLIILPPKDGYKLNENYSLKIDVKSSKKSYFQSFRYVSKRDEKWFGEYLKNNVSGTTKNILNNPDDYKLQLLYTEVTRDTNGVPYFDSYSYNMVDENYFYPASSIKLSSCLLSLEKINNLNIKNLDMYSTMDFSQSREVPTRETINSIYGYIKNILLYSDNYSFNKLYEFLGQEYYNEHLKKHGYNNTKIIHRLSKIFDYEDNKYSSEITFLDESGNPIYSQPEKYNSNNLFNTHPTGLTLGSCVQKDFSKKNSSSLKDLQGILSAVIFNDYFKNEYKYNLTHDDLVFLRKYLEKTDHKYLLYGGNPYSYKKNIHMLNKYGMAYGFFIDNGYFYDDTSKKEFLLTAVIYANKNGYLDDIYQYHSKSIPFLKEIGEVVLDYK
ncbi:serine hydrolase [Oceanirhabdus seepicola]|uniref:Serine hydrolase n=1 Tax=Oceanirhabdus seepicola TaxID=2828781 RepID=A0A9J6P259_9CLOT|nr:serine hydrolase [Oceanirhabdus seepicola]MCM1989981.1 serine hydrolase [Oceanirhabdus seepicola]